MSTGRGIGRGASLSNFEPMREDYEDPCFNSFNPAGSELVERRKEHGTKLYVRNIPSSMTEEGIKNAFRPYGNVVSYKGSGSHHNNKFCFVEYDSPMAAQRAVTELNRKQPWFMVVQYAMDSNDKRRSAEMRHSSMEGRRPASDSGGESVMPLGRGRAFQQPQAAPLQGVPPSSVYKSQFNDDGESDSQSQVNLPNGFSPTSFNHPNDSRLVMSGQTFVMENQGHGSSIRSYNYRRKQGIFFPCFPGEGRSQAVGHLSRETVARVNHGFNIMMEQGLFKFDTTASSDDGTPCRVCKTLTVRLCSPCLLPFCTTKCLLSDKTHDCLEEETKLGYGIPVLKLLDGKVKNGTIGSSAKKPSGNIKDFRERNKDESTFVRSPTGSSVEVSASLRPKDPQESSPAAEFNPQDHWSNRHSYSQNRRSRRTYETDAKPDKRTPTCPLPLDIFTQVLVTNNAARPNEFWVQKESSTDKQKELMLKLKSHSMKPNLPSIDPEVGKKCMALWEGTWFRAKMIKVDGNKIEVLYVDFGNTDFVTRDAIKPLPQDCVSEMPLAFKVRLAEGTPTRYEKPEPEDSISVKPVGGKVGDCWTVQVEGVKYKEKEWRLPKEFTEVNVAFCDEDSGLFWVILGSDLSKLTSIAAAMVSNPPRVTPNHQLGEMYAVEFDGAWARCELKSLDPTEVFFVDYGNRAKCKASEIKQLSEELKKTPAMAFPINILGRIKPFTELEVLSVKPFKEVNGVLHCELQGGSSEVAEDPANLFRHSMNFLEPLDSGVLKVTQMLSDTHLVGTLTLNGARKQILSPSKISENLKSVKLDPNYKPSLGDQVLVEDSDGRKRGFVMRLNDQNTVVALYDFGLVKSFQAVSPLPEDMQVFPECSVRCIFSVAFPERSKLMGTSNPFQVHQNANGIIQADFASYGEAEIVAWEPMIEEAGLSAVQIESGSVVTITSFKSAQTIYVQSVTERNIEKLEAVMQDVAFHCRNSELLRRKPLTGEVVACKFSEDGVYYRAQITKRRGETFSVIYLDFGNLEDGLTIDDMKPLSEGLKRVPCCAVKLGLKDMPEKPLKPSVHKYFTRLVGQLLEITYSSKDLGSVTLCTKKGVNVNDTVRELNEHFWVKALREKGEPCGDTVYMTTDIQYVAWPVKEPVSIVIMGSLSIGEKLATATSMEYFDCIATHLVNEMHEYCTQTPCKSYSPRQNEVVIVRYAEDGKWYRAVCSKAASSGITIAHVLFIDYGNRGQVPHTEIRRMTPDFMETPALLKRVTILGIPKQIPESAVEAINKHLAEGSVHQAIVVEDSVELGVSSVWIPSVAKIFRKLKIDVKSPL